MCFIIKSKSRLVQLVKKIAFKLCDDSPHLTESFHRCYSPPPSLSLAIAQNPDLDFQILLISSRSYHCRLRTVLLPLWVLPSPAPPHRPSPLTLPVLLKAWASITKSWKPLQAASGWDSVQTCTRNGENRMCSVLDVDGNVEMEEREVPLCMQNCT